MVRDRAGTAIGKIRGMESTLDHIVGPALVAVGAAAAIASLPGTIELLLLTLASLFERRAPRPRRTAGLRLAVVIPAHDEEALVARCVHSLEACRLAPAAYEVVVVADNCSDATAARAAEAGARVIERRDESRRGKGFALRHAFDRLAAEGFDAFAVVDADSTVAPNFVAEIAACIADGADAVQAPYGVLNPDVSVRTRLMKTALLAFNRLRLQGRAALGLSVGILGNGFAVTRETLAAVPWDAESVVEDLEYHLRLVRSGRRVDWAGGTEVRADMPTGAVAARQQRARWEGGRLRMLIEHAPALAGEVARGRWRSLEPLLEILLLPLAFHVVLVALAAAAPAPLLRTYGAIALGAIGFHLLLALRAGRGGAADLAALAAAPFYVAWKLAVAPAIVRAAQPGAAWRRTPRELADGGLA